MNSFNQILYYEFEWFRGQQFAEKFKNLQDSVYHPNRFAAFFFSIAVLDFKECILATNLSANQLVRVLDKLIKFEDEHEDILVSIETSSQKQPSLIDDNLSRFRLFFKNSADDLSLVLPPWNTIPAEHNKDFALFYLAALNVNRYCGVPMLEIGKMVLNFYLSPYPRFQPALLFVHSRIKTHFVLNENKKVPPEFFDGNSLLYFIEQYHMGLSRQSYGFDLFMEMLNIEFITFNRAAIDPLEIRRERSLFTPQSLDEFAPIVTTSQYDFSNNETLAGPSTSPTDVHANIQHLFEFYSKVDYVDRLKERVNQFIGLYGLSLESFYWSPFNAEYLQYRTRCLMAIVRHPPKKLVSDIFNSEWGPNFQSENNFVCSFVTFAFEVQRIINT